MAETVRRGRKTLQYTISAILTIVFLYLAFRGTDFPLLYQSILSANYWWMFVVVALLLLSHFFRAWRWRYLLDPIKSNISLRNLFSGVMVGYFLNNLLPRAGELGRPYAIGKLERIPKSAAFGTIVVERIMDMISFLALVSLLPLMYDGPLREEFPWLARAGILTSLVVGVTLALFIGLMIRRDWTDTLLVKLGGILPERLRHRFEGMAHSFLDGFLFVKHPRHFFVIAVFSAIIWFLYIMMMYVSFLAFGLQGHLGLRAALVVQTISSVGVAIPTPGATGSYHAFTSQALSRLFFIEPNLALSFATVTHAVGFIGVTIVGLWYFWRDSIPMSEAVRGESHHE